MLRVSSHERECQNRCRLENRKRVHCGDHGARTPHGLDEQACGHLLCVWQDTQRGRDGNARGEVYRASTRLAHGAQLFAPTLIQVLL